MSVSFSATFSFRKLSLRLQKRLSWAQMTKTPHFSLKTHGEIFKTHGLFTQIPKENYCNFPPFSGKNGHFPSRKIAFSLYLSHNQSISKTSKQGTFSSNCPKFSKHGLLGDIPFYTMSVFAAFCLHFDFPTFPSHDFATFALYY